ncbi:MAG TPA: ABC transporter substrate-binding protein, partial [Sorangium sp.]|nr:ABC transporter substrate-binding protein [Sorangium sp.]
MNRATPRRAFILSALLLSAGAAAGCSSKEGAAVAQERRGAASTAPAPTPAPQPQAKGAALVTVAREQQATWVRNFNPLLPEGNSRFPTVAGI